MSLTIKEAAKAVQSGGVIAYATEAVYGLGCDPLNESAVRHLLALKSRPVEKGLILISDDFNTLTSYLNMQDITMSELQSALETWPGPFTWIFPASPLAPVWIKGAFDSIAIRVTQHPLVCELCKALKAPLVSTSANITGALPARNPIEVSEQFPKGLAGIVIGEVDLQRGPSEIRDVKTQLVLRS